MSCITPILRSSHWFRITERIEYKLLSFTYKVHATTQPPYLQNLISVQRPRSTRSSSVITLVRPPSSSSLKITDRSFRYVSEINSLYLFVNLIPVACSSTISDSPIPSPITSSSSDSPLYSSITPSLFYSRHKSTCFTNPTPTPIVFTSSRTAFTDYCKDRFF